MTEYKLNWRAGVVAVIVCLAAMLIIYQFTVGMKVSRQTTGTPTGGYINAPPGPLAPAAAGTSHARPGPTETPAPKKAGDKKPLPPSE